MKSHQSEIFYMMTRFSHLNARFLTFPMVTAAVIEGHAFAAGLLWALTHDHRLMWSKSHGKCCLSALNIGLLVPEPWAAIPKYLLPPQSSRELIFGHKYSPQEAH